MPDYKLIGKNRQTPDLVTKVGRNLVLDLKDVVLVDRDIVRFLREHEGNGIVLRNCPPYAREWIARVEEQP